MLSEHKTPDRELNLDTRLTELFLKETKQSNFDEQQLGCCLPTQDPLFLRQFLKTNLFSKGNGDKFREKTRSIINHLIQWSVEHHIPAIEIANLNEFYHGRLLYSGHGNLKANQSMLPLLRQGVLFLAEIAHLLTDDTKPLQTRVDVLRNLLAGIHLSICPEGNYTHICEAHSKLFYDNLVVLKNKSSNKQLLHC